MLKKIINNLIIRFLGAIASIVTFIYIFRKGLWGLAMELTNLVGRFVNLLVMYWRDLVFVVFAILILVFYFNLGRFKKYIATSFKDDFKKDLHKNWYYIDGTWELLPGGELRVTQSEIGGITRAGHLWTDYSFEFTAVIVNRCIAWIVRAQDLFNHYMIQLDRVNVRPHLRFAGRWVSSGRVEDAASIITTPHGQSIHPDNTIEVRTEVRGSEIRVYVNNNQIYHDQTFFSARFIDQGFVLVQPQPGAIAVPPFTTGRVGFRESAREIGRFSWCRVRPL